MKLFNFNSFVKTVSQLMIIVIIECNESNYFNELSLISFQIKFKKKEYNKNVKSAIPIQFLPLYYSIMKFPNQLKNNLSGTRKRKTFEFFLNIVPLLYDIIMCR